MKIANPPIPFVAKEALPEKLSSGPAPPLVLFPVRLETRFFQLADGRSELRVRVYPDKVHIDSHEPALTDEEVTWGQHFWEQTWLAGNDVERKKAAWRQLAERLDPPRAAWVARALKPAGDPPAEPLPADASLPKPINFPTPERQSEPWMRPALTRLLPNFWIVLGYKDGHLAVNAKGAAIREPLAAGPDPSDKAKVDEAGIDEGMKWMVDFDVAEKAGMGIRATLSPQIGAVGLDFLLVLGVKDAGVDTDWTPQLTEIFNAHHYSDGLSFVPPGTPTNNTANTPSGFSSEDPGHEASYEAEWIGATFDPKGRADADVLTTALGLPGAPEIFANLPHAADLDQLDAEQMNRALWQATWGYFLLQMLGTQPGESPLTDADIKWARDHFVQYVRATGPLPSIRVGKQPYGFLPVTSLDAWRPESGHEKDESLRRFLIGLREIWRGNLSETPRLGRTEDTQQQSGIDKDLKEVLSMEGVSSHYSMRSFLGRHYLEHLWVFLTSDFFKDVWNPPEPDESQLPQDTTDDEELDLEGLPPFITGPARKKLIEQRKKKRRDDRLKALRAEAAVHLAASRGRKTNAANAWWATQQQLTTAVLQSLDISWVPRLAKGVFSSDSTMLNGPLVQADSSASLSPNYIEALWRARNLNNEVRFHAPSLEQPPPHTLLHLLLRHSMLLEYTNAATRLLIKRMTPPPPRREPELIDLLPEPPLGRPITPTVWRQLALRLLLVPGDTNPVELSHYLLGMLDSGDPKVADEPELLAPLSDFRASLDHLRSLSVAKLEQLLTGTLDLCSHRLDAWITSFATKRLDEIRAGNKTSVQFGGYGWVMNLKPVGPQPKLPVPGETEPMLQPAKNPGFVHAPSLAQASTVAILRSAHLAHAGPDKQKPNDLLAIDLSSERVRLASWLLDGVRQGQPLGALLGYRFERGLQKAGAAKFIASFRELAPLVARKLDPPPGVAVEAIAANNVVDGLALLRRWQKGNSLGLWIDQTIPFGKPVGKHTALPPFDEDNLQFKAVAAEIELLEQAVDAVSDALLAESVHQVVRGNPLRAANTVESIAGGETPPPELEVVQTPRTGVAFTHRVLTLFTGEGAPPDWPKPAHPFRADAEPHLNAWAAKLLPNPANVHCIVEQVEPQTEKVLQSKELVLGELLVQLPLAPLDFIYAIEGGQGGQQAEIEQRIFYHAQQKGHFPAGAVLRVSPGRGSDWPVTKLSYGEFSELLRAARKLLTGVRAIDDDDLNPPERNTTFSVVVEKLEARAAAAGTALKATLDDGFGKEPGALAAKDAETLRKLILQAATFGVTGAVPLSAVGDAPTDRELLLVQAESIKKELEKRLAEFAKLDPAPAPDAPPATDEARRDRALAKLHVVFGKGFVVLPLFTTGNLPELKQALAASDSLQTGETLAAPTWFQRMARVREGVGRLNTALSYAEALDTGEKLNLTIAQLPFNANDRWVALPFKGNDKPVTKLSLAVQSVSPVKLEQPQTGELLLAGALIDEWVEVVPSPTEITGIALQYDQPNSAPPQTILIAVPPEKGLPWTTWSLQKVLLETLDLARIRAVDSEALDEVGHYLPALYFASNTLNDTVSTDFTTIK